MGSENMANSESKYKTNLPEASSEYWRNCFRYDKQYYIGQIIQFEVGSKYAVHIMYLMNCLKKKKVLYRAEKSNLRWSEYILFKDMKGL